MRWKTVPKLAKRVAALLPVEDLAATVAALRTPSLEACDFFTRTCVPDAPGELNVLAEWAADHDPLEEIAEALGDREALDRRRHHLPRAAVGDARGHPGAHPRARRPGQARRRRPARAAGRVPRRRARTPPATRQAYLFGHLGDGNVHVNLVGDAPDEDAVLPLVLELGGTISAEHGVGVAKAAWLERARGSAEVAAMRAIKAALDPQGILNPGVLLPCG